MAEFCLPAKTAEEMKQAARKGEFKVSELFAMTSQERQDRFAKVVDRGTAKQINAAFEGALSKNTEEAQSKALKKWAEATFRGKPQKKKLNDVMTKIDKLKETGALTPEAEKSFLSDLVAEKLGATITADEARNITERANKLEDLASKVERLGDPTDNPQGQIEYFKAKQEMNDYLASLTPSHRLKVLSSTIGRGSMLFSLKSPLLNIESNSIQGFLHLAERRIAGRSVRTLNNGFALKYMKFVNKIYKESGYDISRFQTMGGERTSLGEEYLHSQGPGVIRKIGRAYEDLIFKKTQGAPDVAFSAFHFADSVNLKSSVIARTEGLRGSAAKARALEIFKDATSLEPSTNIGVMVRAQAEADAAIATYTNKSVYADVGLGIRKVFNIASGDARIGDQMMPFVKTPANVLGASLEASGIIVPVDTLWRMGKTLNEVRTGVPVTEAWKTNFAGYYRSLVRAGLGLTFAYILSSLIKPDDFIGAYPTNPKEQQLLKLRNGVANSIRIGNTWVSLDYLGPLGAPLLGFLYAKKYQGKTPVDYAFRYFQGAKQQIQNLPGIEQVAQVYEYLKTPPSEKDSINAVIKDQEKNILGFISSRIIPGFVSDIAKMTDKYDRAVDKNNIFAQVQKNIPGLRQGLPIQKNLFGDEVKTEQWSSTLLFGARIKSAADGQIINELVKLSKDDALPAISNVDKTSSRAKELKTQIGEEKFGEAMTYFGNNLKAAFLETMNDPDYQTSNPQDKQNLLNKSKEEVFNDMLDTYGYVKPEKE